MLSGRAVAAAGSVADGFTVTLDDGAVVGARRLLVATGLRDELPEVPGVRERWGRGVLHCPCCHGWEVRDQAIGVLATSSFAMRTTRLFRQLSDDVTVLLHGAPPLGDDDREELAARGVAVVDGPVTSLRVEGDHLVGVELADGRAVALDALVVSPRVRAGDHVPTSLGVRAEETRWASAPS